MQYYNLDSIKRKMKALSLELEMIEDFSTEINVQTGIDLEKVKKQVEIHSDLPHYFKLIFKHSEGTIKYCPIKRQWSVEIVVDPSNILSRIVAGYGDSYIVAFHEALNRR